MAVVKIEKKLALKDIIGLIIMNKELEQIIDDKYDNLSAEEKKQIYDLFKDKDTLSDLKSKIQKVIFKIPPPSPEEFLDPKNEWLSKRIIDSIFPHIKRQFIEIINGDKDGDPYNKIVEYGGTRLGKSFLIRLIFIYVIVFFHCLRDPGRFYGLSPLAELCIYIVSFKFDKTKQIYLRPIYNILTHSKRFIKVEKSDQVLRMQEKVGIEKIVWSRSAATGEITLASGLQIHMGNAEALSFIGADVVCAAISEISYFCEYAGTSEHEILRLATDLAARIDATVKNGHLCFLYYDTSANDEGSPIENFLIKNLKGRKGVYFNWQSRWEARPDLYPKWRKTGETFKVISGNADHPAKIVTQQEDLEGVPLDLIVNVPIDLKQEFEDNLIRSIKDAAGKPTSNENKFIKDFKHITNLFNNSSLTNIEGIITADSRQFPEDLLWNLLRDKFFNKNASGKYIFKRAPNEIRYWGLDNAYSAKGDLQGFACIHKEWDNIKNKIMYITDFAFVIGPGETGINLSAVPQFLVDLRKYCIISIHGLFTDTFQSQNQIQQLERAQIDAYKQSVDTSLTPYLTYFTHLTNESIKAGKNIFLKNNLSCLVRIKNKNREKIDHPPGNTINKYFGDWENSTAGLYAKDCSDAHCQAFFGAYFHEVLPTTIYQEEQKRLDPTPEDIIDLTNIAYKKLHKFY